MNSFKLLSKKEKGLNNTSLSESRRACLTEARAFSKGYICVLVFASNIDQEDKAARVCYELLKTEGVRNVNVDLEDWENILRVKCETAGFLRTIKKVTSKLGFECRELA